MKNQKVLRLCVLFFLVYLHLDSASAYDSVYLKGSYAVNATGAATYSIPLEIPPGTNGVMPKPILSYSSLGQNGLFGMGWSLSGLSSISRCTVNRFGSVARVELSAFDNYCLDGVLLAPVDGVPQAEYRTEIDDFQKIYSIGNTNDNYFVVYTKNGQKLTFGQSSDSRIKAQNNPAIVTWALDSVTDLNGNYYKLVYHNDQLNGQYYPLEINYTGNALNGVTPRNSMKFSYETRPDITPSYRADIKLTPFTRVKNIKTYAGEKQIYDYQFSYQQSSQTGRSLLKKVTVFSADGSKSLLPANFEWNGPGAIYSDDFILPAQIMSAAQSVPATYIDGVESGNGGSGIYTSGTADWMSGDFNGDGISDFIQLRNGGESAPICFGSFGASEFKCTNFALPAKLPGNGVFLVGDFDGDGFSDFVHFDQKEPSRFICYSNGKGQFSCETKYMPRLDPVPNANINIQYNGMPTLHKQYFSGDFNGDGRADIFVFSAASISPKVCYSSGRFASDYCISTPLANDFIPINMVVGDFDADGRIDVAYAPLNPLYTGAPESTEPPTITSSFEVCYGGEAGFTCQLKPLAPRMVSTDCTLSICLGSFFAGDFNGDGASDLAQFTSDGKINVYPSMGRGIQGTSNSTSLLFNNIGSWKDIPFMVADLNGDGKADIITKNETDTEICYSRGDGSFNCTVGPAITQSKVLFGNFTGDTTTSIVTAETTSSSLTAFLNPVVYPDTISQIKNGIGGKIDIVYNPLSNGTVHTKSVGSSYPIKDIQNPVWVVASEKLADGNGGQREKTYKYFGSKYDLKGHGSLGFSQIEQMDVSAKTFSRTKYDQVFPHSGQATELVKYAYNSNIKKYVKTEENRFKYGSLMSQASPPFPTYYVYLMSQQDITYDISFGALEKNTHVNYQYDNRGNKISEIMSTSDGNIVEKSFTIKNFTGDPNLDPTQWFLGRVEKVQQKNTTSNGVAITRTTSYLYDSKHRLLQENKEANGSERYLQSNFSYDDFGNINSKGISGSDLPVRTENIYYDDQGALVIAKENSYGHRTEYDFDIGFGVVKSVKDANGLITKSQYDDFGRKINIILPDGASTKYGYRICTANLCGTNQSYFVEIKPTGGATQLTYFDSLDRIVTSQEGTANGQWIYKYRRFDNLGNLKWTSRATKGQPQYFTKYEYDVLNRLVLESNPDGAERKISYDALSSTITNNVGQKKTEVKDSLGRTISIIDDAGNTVSYAYDPLGNIVSTEDTNGNVTKMSYDILGHMVSKTDKDSGTWTYKYNALGEVIYSKDSKNNVITTAYDDTGRVVEQVTTEGTSTWMYDFAANGVGKIFNESRDNGYSKSYIYDSLGRPSKIQTTMDTSYDVSLSYDGLSRVNKITYPTGFAVKYKYDMNGFLTEVRNAVTDTLLWKVTDSNADGMPLTEIFGNNISVAKTYYPETGRLFTSIATPSGASAIQDVTFGYDALGNLTNRAELVNQSTGAKITENFSYDNLNRLVSVSGPTSKTFSYDNLGNIVNKSDVGIYAYGDGTPGRPVHGVVSVAGTSNLSFTYDSNGNMLTGNGRTISWTSFNKPSSITNPNNAVTFHYDTRLERYKEVATTCRDAQGVTSSTCVKYLINPAPGVGIHFEKEIHGSTITNRHYIYAGPSNIIGVYSTTNSGATNTRYFHKDILGTISVITNESGAVVERLSFDAFGKRRNVDGTDDPLNSLRSLTTHQGFTAQQHIDDGQMGIIHFNGRIYDPLVAKFMSADPLVSDPSNLQSLNRYSYVINNPLNLTDSTGYFLDNVVNWVKNRLGEVGDHAGQAAGYVVGVAFPIQSVILLNTTDVFQQYFGFSQNDKNLLNTYYVGLAAGGAAYVTGGLAAAYFFPAGGFAAIATGTIVGAAVGGTIGALSFPVMGIGSSDEGYIFGAAVGGVSGGLGAYTSGFLGNPYKGRLLEKGFNGAVKSLLEGSAAPGSSVGGGSLNLISGTAFANFLAVIEPYVVGIGGGIIVNYHVHHASQGIWNIPLLPLFGEDL